MKGSGPLPLLIFFFLSPGLFGAEPLAPLAAEPGEARSRVLEAAGQYLGTPYRYGGVDRRGLDCSGLVYLSFRDALGVQVPRSTLTLYIWAEKLPDSRLLPGDLVFFNTLGTGKAPVSHVGIYAGEGRFIHAASEGPKTGVMFSALSEDYWRRTYVGAGRALPEGPQKDPAPPFFADTGKSGTGTSPENRSGELLAPRDRNGTGDRVGTGDRSAAGQWLLGFALAPTWGGIREDAPLLRGGAMAARFAYRSGRFKRPLLLGVEIRPEWDADLGIFRLPLTLSLGVDDIIRIFAGPAFTLGNPVLSTPGGERRYDGGARWLGAVGITLAPLRFKFARGTLSVYGEFAWQAYTAAPGQGKDWIADTSAGLRISTGLSYTWVIGE